MRTRQLVAMLLALLAWRQAHAAAKQGADAPPKPKVGAHWVLHHNGHHSRPQQLDVSLGLLYSGLGVAAWYALPVAEDGLIEALNDSLDVEFGGLFGLFSSGFWDGSLSSYGLSASGGVRWNFFLTDAWTTFATLKLAFNFGFSGYAPALVYPGLSLGALWRLGRVTLLRLELGHPFGLSVGLSFDL